MSPSVFSRSPTPVGQLVASFFLGEEYLNTLAASPRNGIVICAPLGVIGLLHGLSRFLQPGLS